MRYGLLARWAVGFTLAASLGTINCGGDDTTTTSGTGGSGGTGGASTTTASGGKGGTGGTAGNGGNGGTAGNGGSAGAAGSAGKGGTGGTGGTSDAGGGSGGTGGTGGASTDGGTDAPADAPKADGSDAPTGETGVSDGGDASDGHSADAADGAVAFSAVTAIFDAHCVKCHKSNDGAMTGLLDLQTPTGLYTRLTSPLPDGQEGKCGYPDGGLPATGDGGDAAAPSNRVAIAPGDTSASLLFLKIAGTQPMTEAGVAGCGLRMPRIPVFGDDGGPAGSVACDMADGGAAANCLSQTDLETIQHWIERGAPQN